MRDYYQVAFGKIIKSLGDTEPQNMDGVTKRFSQKANKHLYEIRADFIAGHIVAARMKDPPEDKKEFGKKMALTLMYGNGHRCVLEIKFDSAYGRGFLFALPNLDLSQAVEIEPYAFTPQGSDKEKMGLMLFQNGKKLDWAYGTKDKPGDMPKLKKTKFKGQEVWDNSEQLAYLEKQFLAFCELVNTSTHEELPDTDHEDYEEPEAPARVQATPKEAFDAPVVAEQVPPNPKLDF